MSDSVNTAMDTEQPNQDHDSPWKEALECRFQEFLALLFPAVHQQIDWKPNHHVFG